MFYQKTVLDNGITVISEQMEGVRSVALGMWIRVGNRDETPDVYGMSHFMEHMLFKGTPTRSATDISIAFDAMGAELNAFTSREYTCFYSRMIDTHLNDGFEILADMVVNASFTHETIVPERKVVLEEIARSEDNPEDNIYDVFADALFPMHPLGRPVLGTRDIVANFETDDMRAYHDKHYRTGNLTVVACGSIDHEKLIALAQKWLCDMLPGERKVREPQTETARKQFSIVKKDTEQAHIIMGMPTICQTDDRRFAYGLADLALGGGMSSRLFLEIREERGLVYSVYSASQLYADTGIFAMYAGTNPKNIAEVVKVAQEQFNLMAEKGLTEEELSRVRELACGNFVLGMESTARHMTRLGRMATCGIPLTSIDEVLEGYRAVTLDDVNAAAAELLAKDPTIAVISPYHEDEIIEMIG